MTSDNTRREGIPGHIAGNPELEDLTALWEEMVATAQQQGVDPRRQPIQVSDEHQIGRLRALEVLGGATVQGTEGGVEVRLTFEEPPPPQPVDHTPSQRAAAKKHSFADEEGENQEN